MAMQHGLKTTPNDKNNVAYFDDFGLLKNQEEGVDISNEFESVKIKLVDYAGIFTYTHTHTHTNTYKHH